MAVVVQSYASLDEAARSIQPDPRTRIFGGGTLLMPAVNAGTGAFDRIVRISDAILGQIRVEGERVSIGAGVTMAQIGSAAELAFLAPVAGGVGGPAVRNMATVGGNLFAANPYGDLAVALLALDASVFFADAGGSATSMDDFLRGREQYRGRILRGVSVARPEGEGAFRWLKVSRIKPKGVSVISIAARLPRSGRGVRVAFGNIGSRPVRSSGAERALEGSNYGAQEIERAAHAALEGLSPHTDALASEWYRREVAPVHLKRLLSGNMG